MLSKNLIKSYDFQTRKDYFNYVVESITNGQRQQARNLIGKLSKDDKKEAISYFEQLDNMGGGINTDAQEAKQFIIESF